MEPDPNAEFHALQDTLRQFAPAPLPNCLRRQLESTARDSAPLADRILATWSTAGALAACLVAALTAWQLLTAPVPVTPTRQEIAQRQQIVLENQKLIAAR